MHDAYPISCTAAGWLSKIRRPSTQIGRINQLYMLLIPVPHLDNIMKHTVGQYAAPILAARYTLCKVTVWFCLAISLTFASAFWYPLCRVVGWALLRIPFSCHKLGVGKLKALTTHTLHKGHHIFQMLYQPSFFFTVNITHLVFTTTRSTLNTSQHGLPQIIKSKSSMVRGASPGYLRPIIRTQVSASRIQADVWGNGWAHYSRRRYW